MEVTTLSDGQPIRSSRHSRIVLDVGMMLAGASPLTAPVGDIHCAAHRSFSGTAGAFEVQLHSSNDEKMADPIVHATTGLVPPELWARREFRLALPPRSDLRRYLALYYAVHGGELSAGSLLATLTVRLVSPRTEHDTGRV